METYKLTKEESFDIKNRTAKPMLWIGLVSIVMFFAGLTSAYVIRQAQGDWLYFDLPSVFYVSTAVIIASSLTMALAQFFAKKGNSKLTSAFLMSTLILGITFMVLQYQGFFRLHEQGVNFTGPESNISGSFFIVLVFAHFAHVLAGVLSLLFTTIKAMLNRYTVENHIGVNTAGIYWHFLDILWIYLILFLVFIR